jgi:hypothetical protein
VPFPDFLDNEEQEVGILDWACENPVWATLAMMLAGWLVVLIPLWVEDYRIACWRHLEDRSLGE